MKYTEHSASSLPRTMRSLSPGCMQDLQIIFRPDARLPRLATETHWLVAWQVNVCLKGRFLCWKQNLTSLETSRDIQTRLIAQESYSSHVSSHILKYDTEIKIL
jgi:hypothetical protein